MADFTPIRAQVARQTTVINSVKTLLADLKTRLEDAADDPQEINAIASEIGTQLDDLAAAVVEHTPSEGEPPAPPVA